MLKQCIDIVESPKDVILPTDVTRLNHVDVIGFVQSEAKRSLKA